jgi:peptidoglycan/LPS O-acetylase OafA/YrhL
MPEIRPLTGIRGVAALSVALVHLHFDRFTLIRFFEFHDQAVDLFFCLSGFTLALVYQVGDAKTLGFRRYAVARIARIYPLYAAVLIFCWWQTVRHLAGSGIYPETLFIADAIRNFLLINSWPLIGSGSNWDSPGWSLSVEAFCYIAVFPALFALSARAVQTPSPWRLGSLIFLMFASFFAFSRYWDVQILIARAYTAAHAISYFIPLIRGIMLFTAGWIIHGFWRERGAIAMAAGVACDAIALAAILVLGCAYFGLLPKACLVFLAPPLVLGLAMNPRALTSRFLGSWPAVFLGEISYALYLLHEPLQSFVTGHFPHLSTMPGLDSAVMLGALLAVSTASYYGFEKPARALIKRGAGP